MVRFSHVYKTYEDHVHALRNVDFFIPRGEFVFLIGPSGSGKTTIFRLLSGYDTPSSGLVEVNSLPVSELSAHKIALFRREIGVVFQDFRLLQNLSVYENVALPLRIRNEKSQQIDRRVKTILNEVGLKFKTDRLPRQLSGGEQQRVAIARALVHQPAVLIADEPTGNLDPDLSREIIDLLEAVNAQGTTVFVATHDHELLRLKAKRVIEIRAGELAKPNAPFTEAGR